MIMVTEETIRSGKRTSVGSIVCKHKVIENGVPTLFLHTAIPMTLEQFIPNAAGEGDFSAINKLFSQLATHMKKALFTYQGASSVEEYGVFTFAAPEGWRSLAELPLPLEPQAALDIFSTLLKTIDEYRRCDINDDGYRPLLFICPESVYVMFDKDGKLQDLQLLPMPYDSQAMYEGMPREISHIKPDLSADISMAAYLYLLLKYTKEKPFNEAVFTRCDALAEQCLSPFPHRRPSLEQLLAAVQSDAASKDGDDNNDNETHNEGKRGYLVITDDQDEEEQPSAPPAPKKPKRGLFGGKGNQKVQKPKKPKKKSIVVSAMGTVEDILSTEDADRAEEE